MTSQETSRIPRVVVDDLRDHPDGAMYFRTSASAITWLQDNPTVVIDELWLDHDLGGLDDTIRPVVLYLEELCFNGTPIEIGCIYVHTANPTGAAWIQSSNLLKANYKMLRNLMPRYSVADLL